MLTVNTIDLWNTAGGRSHRAIPFALPAILLASTLTACQSSPPIQLVYPDGPQRYDDWTEAQRRQDIAVRTLSHSEAVSTHLIRLKGREFPHYHDRHDLSVTVLAGTAVIHFKEHGMRLGPGDAVFIPRGNYHWAENTGPEASIVHAVFSPGFDGKDRRRADAE